MEVHHHPHIEKKNFKEYILEYLMIVLAVITGFFAESFREFLNDHSKEKEYIVHIKKDLEADTANLNIWIPGLKSSINDLDTLIAILQNPINTSRGSDMYFLARLTTRTRLFETNDNTIIELKNSGNFRLIRNRSVLDGLVDIEKAKIRYININNVATQESELLYPLIGILFDEAVFNKMITPNSTTATISEEDFARASKKFFQKPSGNPQLRMYNKDIINQLCYYLHQRRSTFDGEIRLLNTLKLKSSNLINLVKKEYHLEHE